MDVKYWLNVLPQWWTTPSGGKGRESWSTWERGAGARDWRGAGWNILKKGERTMCGWGRAIRIHRRRGVGRTST